MAQDKLVKKMRKEMKKHGDFILHDFQNKFKLDNYIRPKPMLIPKFLWYMFINWLLKK